MNELFSEKPWVKPLTVAGSHIEEEENTDQENTPKKCKTRHIFYLYKYAFKFY